MHTRRTLLRGLGVATFTVLGGCAGGDDPSNPSTTQTDTSTRTTTRSQTTDTPVRTPTETPTETATPTPKPWTAVARMPVQRTEIRGAVLDGELYVIGGFDGDQRDQKSVLRYDPAADEWDRAPPLPANRHHVGVAVHDGRLYAIGGLSGDETNWTPHSTVWVLDGDEWNERAPMPTPRGAGVAAAVDGRIYVVGGSDAKENKHMSMVEAYDPAADRWREAPPMPYGTQSVAGGVVDGRLYVCGGRTTGVAGGKTFDTFVRFDPATGNWKTLAPVPNERAGFGMAVRDGKLWAIGGEVGFRALDEVDVYDPVADEWSTGHELPTGVGRHGHVAAAIDGTIYVAGGTFPPGASANDSVIALGSPSGE